MGSRAYQITQHADPLLERFSDVERTTLGDGQPELAN